MWIKLYIVETKTAIKSLVVLGKNTQNDHCCNKW